MRLTEDIIHLAAAIGDMDSPHKGRRAPVAGMELEVTLQILQAQWVHNVRATTKDTIKNRAKVDHLTKVITYVQALWLLTQVTPRGAQSVAVTLSGLTATAYILCAIGAYALWWQKPPDYTSPVVFNCVEAEVPLFIQNCRLGPTRMKIMSKGFLHRWNAFFSRSPMPIPHGILL